MHYINLYFQVENCFPQRINKAVTLAFDEDIGNIVFEIEVVVCYYASLRIAVTFPYW